MLKHCLRVLNKVKEDDYTRLVRMQPHVYLENMITNLLLYSVVTKEGKDKEGFIPKSAYEELLKNYKEYASKVNLKYKSEISQKDDEIRTLKNQVGDLEDSVNMATIRIADLEKQADGLARSNLALTSDKEALQKKLRDISEELSGEKKAREDAEGRASTSLKEKEETQKLLTTEALARKEYEEKAVGAFLAGYRTAQSELLERDPNFDGSWMALGFDKKAIRGGGGDEDEEMGGAGGQAVASEGETEEGGEAQTVSDGDVISGAVGEN